MSVDPRAPASPVSPADKLVATRAWKSPWLVTLLEAYGGRLAIEATMEPPVTMGRNQGRKVPCRGGMSPLNQRLATAEKLPLKP